jgi:uncharacterized protein YjgD (DUF1641 family)
MAQPIPLELPTRDPNAQSAARLERAPAEHADALLAGIEVLQSLHDRGVLELLKGAVDGGDKILELVVDVSKSEEAIRGMRNLLILSKTFASIDPDLMQRYARVIPGAIESAAKAEQEEPPGILRAIWMLRGKNFRRGLNMVNSLIDALRV